MEIPSERWHYEPEGRRLRVPEGKRRRRVVETRKQNTKLIAKYAGGTTMIMRKVECAR